MERSVAESGLGQRGPGGGMRRNGCLMLGGRKVCSALGSLWCLVLPRR